MTSQLELASRPSTGMAFPACRPPMMGYSVLGPLRIFTPCTTVSVGPRASVGAAGDAGATVAAGVGCESGVAAACAPLSGVEGAGDGRLVTVGKLTTVTGARVTPTAVAGRACCGGVSE